ncbi:MAG: ABC transporter substrate-binding protein [Firmicutes bacterium]|nr:ABC transporter substrate-binding protein [Bacillota bacterium]
MKKGKIRFVAMLLALLMTFVFAGCGAKEDAAPVPSKKETNASQSSPAPAPAASEPAKIEPAEPRHLNAASHMVGTSLDSAANYQGWVVTRAGIGETLLKLNDAVELEGCLADSWEWTNDYTLKLHIRDGVTFQNGKKLDADSVKASFERTAEINNRFPMYIDLKEFRTDGEYFIIESNSMNPQMLWNLVEPCFCVMDVTAADPVNAPVGTGPYKVVSFVEDHIELEVYADYWRGTPGLDTITFTKISDAQARVMGLQSGELDVTVTIDNTNLSLFDNPDYNVSLVTGARTNVVKMNNKSRFLSSKELRQAISWAIDRETYSKTITGGEASTCIFPSSTPFDAGSINGYGFDQEKASKILDDAGIVDKDGDGIRELNGENIVLDYYQTAAHGSSEAGLIAQAIQSDVKKIGIQINIQSAENLSEVRKAGAVDFYSDNSNTVPTGDGQYFLNNMYSSASGSNYTGYSSAEFDAVLDEFNRTYEAEKRYELAHKAAQILVDDAADLYVTAVPMNTVSRSYVRNAVQPTIDYYMLTWDYTIEK